MTDVVTVNHKIHQGQDWSITTTLKDDAGDVIDLTGYTAAMQVRRSHNRPALISLTPGSGISINEAGGTISWAMTSAQTALLDGDCVYDQYIESGSGIREYAIKGKLLMTRRTSR